MTILVRRKWWGSWLAACLGISGCGLLWNDPIGKNAPFVSLTEPATDGASPDLDLSSADNSNISDPVASSEGPLLGDGETPSSPETFLQQLAAYCDEEVPLPGSDGSPEAVVRQYGDEVVLAWFRPDDTSTIQVSWYEGAFAAPRDTFTLHLPEGESASLFGLHMRPFDDGVIVVSGSTNIPGESQDAFAWSLARDGTERVPATRLHGLGRFATDVAITASGALLVVRSFESPGDTGKLWVGDARTLAADVTHDLVSSGSDGITTEARIVPRGSTALITWRQNVSSGLGSDKTLNFARYDIASKTLYDADDAGPSGSPWLPAYRPFFIEGPDDTIWAAWHSGLGGVRDLWMTVFDANMHRPADPVRISSTESIPHGGHDIRWLRDGDAMMLYFAGRRGIETGTDTDETGTHLVQLESDGSLVGEVRRISDLAHRKDPVLAGEGIHYTILTDESEGGPLRLAVNCH